MTYIQAMVSGAVASMALLSLTTTSVFAGTKTLTPSNLTAESQAAQRQRTPMPAQANPTMQQNQQMGCSCCKNMSNKMPGMMNSKPGTMNNMPGMMNQPSPSK